MRDQGPALLIAGDFGGSNTGAEAVLAVVLRDLRARRADLQFSVVSRDPAQTAATYGVRAIAARDIAAIVDAVRAVDGIVLSGGGIFHDDGGGPAGALLTREHAQVPFCAAFPLLAALTGRPCMIYAVGVGPLVTPDGVRLTRGAFEQASVATVRDDESLAELRQIGVDTSRVQATADPAFGLTVDATAGRTVLSELGLDLARPVVAVCMRPWAAAVSLAWAHRVAAGLEAFVQQTGASLVFLPFHPLPDETTTDDLAAAEHVFGKLRAGTRAAVVRGALGPELMAGIVAGCDVVVGMRVHAVIFAALAGVPVVGLVRDAKVASVMRRLGLEDYALPLGAVDRLGERMATAWARRMAIRTALRPRIAELRTRAADNAELAIGLLEAGRSGRATMPDAAWLAEFALAQTRKLAEQQARVERSASHAGARAELPSDRTAEVATLRRQVTLLTAQVSTLTNSTGWRLLEAARGARERLAPRGTRRDRVIRGTLNWLMTLAHTRPGHRGRHVVIVPPMVDGAVALRDVAVVLAGVPMDDSGGGHRPAQLALELLARGWRVVYAHKFAKWEHGDLRLAFDHPRLRTCLIEDFDVAEDIEPLFGGRLLVVVESPHPAFAPVIAALRVRGARVVYDLIDDWASGLGADWYDRATEDLIAANSDVLVASSTVLVVELASRTGRAVRLVPNAVNGRLFDPVLSYDRPGDLAAAVPQILYVGSLWGRWFDWDLVRRVADAYPTGTVTLIGDYRGQCPYRPPRNMVFLGLKAQRDLPAYLAHAEVGLVPFQMTRLTQAMSHLKVFEYLAMRVPVVATPSLDLQDLPHVHLAEDAEAFVAAVGRAAGERVDEVALAAFTRANTWEVRVDTLLAAVFNEVPAAAPGVSS